MIGIYEKLNIAAVTMSPSVLVRLLFLAKCDLVIGLIVLQYICFLASPQVKY